LPLTLELAKLLTVALLPFTVPVAAVTVTVLPIANGAISKAASMITNILTNVFFITQYLLID
jgi:hypothetical protein